MLIEHYAGAFPTWLAPEQARVLPISDDFLDYAQEVAATLRNAGIRVMVDTESETIGAKIRRARQDRLPYMLVVGARELSARQVAVRHRTEGELGACAVDAVIERIRQEIQEKR